MIDSGFDILSLEAKDIYLANQYYDKENGVNIKYSKGVNKGEINLNKFVNTLDFSLESIKLLEIYEKKYRNTRFSFDIDGHSYTTRVINVRYRYNVKEFNKVSKNIFVRIGYKYDELEFNDCVSIKNGELVGILTNEHVENPVSNDILGDNFKFDAGSYHPSSKMKLKMSTSDLRAHTYENGFMCNGIKFVRYKRSSGSSRVGKCLFVDEKLYSMIHKWEMCGITIKEDDEIDLAALEAYIALTLSSIIDTLEIKPENILLIDDYESVFKEKVVETINKNDELSTAENVAEIRNNIFDGQSLMDISLFGKYSHYGMLLLRNRFFKSCCFNCNMQEWFRDNGITDVSQLNGATRATKIEDVKLITTPSSIKYLKFASFDKWLDNLDVMFGIVKHEKSTHYFEGELVQTHYQLINTLQLNEEEVNELLKESFEFLDLLKTNPAVLRYFIKYPIDNNMEITPSLSKNDIVYKMLGINDRFAQTKLYYEFKNDIVKSFIKNMRKGHIFVKGNYSTLCSCPISMLRQAIGVFNGDSEFEKGTIHSIRFKDGEELIGSRSPHVTSGCILLAKNKRYELIDRYMNPTNEIVYVNCIDENLLMRLSGCDFDSDSLLLANNKVLINAARKNYDKFLVSVANVDATKKKRKYTWKEQTELDIKTSNNKIGEIVNLAQVLMSIFWERYNSGVPFDDIKEIYYDVCQLNVLSGIEIDSAKKEYTIDSTKELNKLRSKYKQVGNNSRDIKPYFFKYISQYKGFYDPEKTEYKRHKTSMDYVETAINKYQRRRINKDDNKKYLKFYQIIDSDGFSPSMVHRRQVSRILRIIRDYKKTCSRIYSLSDEDSEKKHSQLIAERQKVIQYIGGLKFTHDTMVYMLKILDNKKYSVEYRTIFNFLFGYPNTSFYEVIQESSEIIETLSMSNTDEYDLKIFDIPFVFLQKTYKKGPFLSHF